MVQNNVITFIMENIISKRMKQGFSLNSFFFFNMQNRNLIITKSYIFQLVTIRYAYNSQSRSLLRYIL